MDRGGIITTLIAFMILWMERFAQSKSPQCFPLGTIKTAETANGTIRRLHCYCSRTKMGVPHCCNCLTECIGRGRKARTSAWLKISSCCVSCTANSLAWDIRLTCVVRTFTRGFLLQVRTPDEPIHSGIITHESGSLVRSCDGSN